MATVSAVRIGNLALSKIGDRGRIESLDENSTQAQEISLWYDFAREEVLKAYNWSFARKRLTLAPHAEDPPAGLWGFRYQYPPDCVSMRRLVNPFGRQADREPYNIESGNDEGAVTQTILTNLGCAVGLYTENVADPTRFSPYFIQCHSTLLAHYIAFALTGKTQIAEQMGALYNRLISSAPQFDANEEAAEPERDAVWTRARHGDSNPAGNINSDIITDILE
jgi:hypothetical protein